MDNQKINVDININTDSLREIPQYKAAFDSLQSSINNLNKEILKYNNQNKETVSWGTKVKNTIKELNDTFNTSKEFISITTEAFKGWQGILSATFTIITTYGPQILDFLSNMFQSEKTKQAAQALKDYKEVMESYIDNVSGEISKVGMLVNVINNKNTSDQLRIEAIKQLNELSPKHLENLTLENIKTKEGKQLLDDYINSLNRKAMEEAVQDKRTEYVKQRMALKGEYSEAKADRDAYKSGKKKDKRISRFTYRPGSDTGGAYRESSPRDKAYERFKDAAEKDKAILSQIAKLDSELAESLLNFAPKPNLNPKHDKTYWETELANQQKALNKLEAGTKGFETKAKPIIKRIRAINKMLSNYSVNEVRGTEKKSQIQKPTTDNEKAYTDFLTKQLLQTTDAFNKKLEQDHANYTTEQTDLKAQLDNKLISQEQYQQQSEQLQQKYHVGIGEMVTQFNKDDLAKAQQLQKDLVDAQQQKGVIDKDQKNVDKAILPGQKLDAEKQLITDKYNYEIKLAADNADKIQELETKKQEALTQLTKQYEQQRNEFIQQAAQQVSNSAFSILQNNIKSQSDAKIKGLEKDKAAELSNKSLTGTQRQAIEAKYQKQEAAEKVKAFKSEQKASILQAVINGALAVTKATSQAGILASFVIPGIIASTAIQVATIAAQKPPQYAQGGLHYQSDGRGALLPGYSRTDNTNAYLRSGEAIVVSEAMRNPWARNLVSAINVAHGGRDFSIPNPSRGYAIGGIFTDGGNANRYYNQPVNDVKELANTLAYQMINNFPPVYVDVKDINNQQNILAQTVNRVNL